MSINKLNLSPYLLASLYSQTLVEAAHPGNPAALGVELLGSYEKHILIVVSQAEYPFLSNADMEFLTSILSACGLGLRDIGLINAKNLIKKDLPAALEKLGPAAILCLGLQPLEMGLPFHFPNFQLQKFNNRTYLYAPSLSEIAISKPLKGQLWHSLKQLFKL